MLRLRHTLPFCCFSLALRRGVIARHTLEGLEPQSDTAPVCELWQDMKLETFHIVEIFRYNSTGFLEIFGLYRTDTYEDGIRYSLQCAPTSNGAAVYRVDVHSGRRRRLTLVFQSGQTPPEAIRSMPHTRSLKNLALAPVENISSLKSRARAAKAMGQVETVALPLDLEVLRHFRGKGPDWADEINIVLRRHVLRTKMRR